MSKFDLESEIEKLKEDYPNMFIAGLKFHIKNNELVIKSKKELDKIVQDFGKLEI